MDIINIVTISNGVTESISSIAIKGKRERKKVIAAAEQKYLDACKDIGLFKHEEDAALDDGVFEGEYKTICLTWSSIIA